MFAHVWHYTCAAEQLWFARRFEDELPSRVKCHFSVVGRMLLGMNEVCTLIHPLVPTLVVIVTQKVVLCCPRISGWLRDRRGVTMWNSYELYLACVASTETRVGHKQRMSMANPDVEMVNCDPDGSNYSQGCQRLFHRHSVVHMLFFVASMQFLYTCNNQSTGHAGERNEVRDRNCLLDIVKRQRRVRVALLHIFWPFTLTSWAR